MGARRGDRAAHPSRHLGPRSNALTSAKRAPEAASQTNEQRERPLSASREFHALLASGSADASTGDGSNQPLGGPSGAPATRPATAPNELPRARQIRCVTHAPAA